jgi:hypothetical protein
VPADHPNGVQVLNEDIALGFEEMAELLALQGENPCRIRAYRRAAQVVRNLFESVDCPSLHRNCVKTGAKSKPRWQRYWRCPWRR